MRGLFVLALGLLPLLTSGTPLQKSYIVHDQRTSTPKGFTSNGPADASSVINFRLALNAKNISGLEERLYAISTPGSDVYGQWMSKEEV